MKKIKKSSPVSVEDLLKLKRLEQPEESFWENFNYGLRQRILREAVNPTPSLWQKILSAFAVRRLAWASLSVLCITFLSKYYVQTETKQQVYSTRFVQLQKSTNRLKDVLDCQNVFSKKLTKVCYDNQVPSVTSTNASAKSTRICL